MFHSLPWLEALRATYNYEPLAITTSDDSGRLKDALLLCRVSSWLTGKRLVCLPFSDHCDPLVQDEESLDALIAVAREFLQRERLRYLEFRPLHVTIPDHGLFRSDCRYFFHEIDLTPELKDILEKFHKSSTQRKIRKAGQGIRYEIGNSEPLLREFYRLMIMTRQRHQLPPQPWLWFKNLVNCCGEALKLRVAYKDKTAVAAIMTLQFKDTLTYKYGCSDARFNHLGGTHLLFWRSIVEAKQQGLRKFDLGRSDLDNPGLVTFKDRWGSQRSMLTYSRITLSAKSKNNYIAGGPDWTERLAKRTLSHLPDQALQLIGDLLYRHVG